MNERREDSRPSGARQEIKTGTPKLGFDCGFCEDWGTLVLIDDRGRPVGTDYCACERGRLCQAKERPPAFGVQA